MATVFVITKEIHDEAGGFVYEYINVFWTTEKAIEHLTLKEKIVSSIVYADGTIKVETAGNIYFIEPQGVE